jgi:hypothetical protein
MCGTCAPLPSSLMGEDSGGGVDSPSSPPSQPSPSKGGRGLDLPLSAPLMGEGEGRGEQWRLLPPPRSSPTRGKEKSG